ncbi:toll/interleukin-1 receptor domain-containing protein [Gloeocapsa sp. PCC 73106]|uniref:toll/interleukin-1 receptor domain-containing protein n=1 Tax=Gloeocapsa sp. PCC 73106 TaxID=102232 RepID=UPI0002ACB35C|nr:toll/interleukin-1 receptor domain-containing protein [Gloeocapsa sp. PCC 73106]ELR98394.1 hypothetical protein GLO73106DRAFT_00022250 [Gloeocapsa sp. PCC 73106]
MEEKLNLVVFPTRTPLGQELAQAVKKQAEEKYGFHVFVHEYDPSHQFIYAQQFISACANADAIVLDATMEDAAEKHNYRFVPPCSLLERLLIVSRSYVPLNFKGAIEGGAAKYSDPYTPLGQKTNQSILDWLDGELQKISKNPRKYNFFQKIIPWYIRFTVEQWRKVGQSEPLYRKKNQVFISYRSRHHARVIELAQRLKNEEKYRDTFIFYLDPGELVYEDELLSPLRRWQLLSMIQDHIIASREVWLYLTEDYLDSWWTKGEVLSTLRFTSQGDLPDKLKIYDPRMDVVYPIDLQHLPKLSEDHIKRMNLYQTNSHPDMMAPEVLDRNQLVEEEIWSRIPAIRRLFMLDEPAFSSEFWDYYIVPCGLEKKRPTNHRTVPDIPQFYEDLKSIDINDFLKFFREGDLIVSLEQLQRAARGTETLTCPNSSTLLIISEQKPRYIWVPQPFTAKKDGFVGRLKELPVFRLINRI